MACVSACSTAGHVGSGVLSCCHYHNHISGVDVTSDAARKLVGSYFADMQLGGWVVGYESFSLPLWSFM